MPDRTTPLHGLDEINWASLDHAYGPATNAPTLIRALLDPKSADSHIKTEALRCNRTVFEQVQDEFYSAICHQGTAYDSTIEVLPFLLNILEHGPMEVDLRRFLVDFLHYCVHPFAERGFPDKPDLNPVNTQCHSVVSGRLKSILPFVMDPDDHVSLRSISLASEFPRQAEMASPYLIAAARTMSPMRSGHALMVLSTFEDPNTSTLAAQALQQSDKRLSIFANCALGWMERTDPSPAVVAALATPIGPERMAHTFISEALGQLPLRVLEAFPTRFQLPRMDSLCRNFEASDELNKSWLVDEILELAFGASSAPAHAGQLTDDQRQALNTLCEHGLWPGQAEAARFTYVLKESGVITEREVLRRWLSS